MVPLETLDNYMLICGILGVTYIVFMLGVLICFLRKYNCNYITSSNPQQLEMNSVPQPYQYTTVNQSSDSILQSYASRSVHSYGSRKSSHMQLKPATKKVVYIRAVDLSQMERLATL